MSILLIRMFFIMIKGLRRMNFLMSIEWGRVLILFKIVYGGLMRFVVRLFFVLMVRLLLNFVLFWLIWMMLGNVLSIWRMMSGRGMMIWGIMLWRMWIWRICWVRWIWVVVIVIVWLFCWWEVFLFMMGGCELSGIGWIFLR